MAQPSDETIATYYTQQSTITDPAQYAYLFDNLPGDLPSLITIVQGLLVFPYAGWANHYGIQVSAARSAELALRMVPRMIAGILALDPAPLSMARPPEKRLYGLCRDFAVLLVSMLRHHGVAARERVGFAGYFNSDWYWDHRITEYWDALRHHWVLVDPRLDSLQQHILHRKIDIFNITREAPFLLAGEAWQLCRTGQADPESFVDSPTDRGMAMIRYALLHDFDALNKVELVGMDAWHDLIDKPESAVTEEERTLLDNIADATVHVDTHFHELRALHARLPYSQRVLEQLAATV